MPDGVDFELKWGDTRKAIVATLRDAAGAALPFDDVEEFRMHVRGEGVALLREPEPVEGVPGQVRYLPTADDYGAGALGPGYYAVEFELVYAGEEEPNLTVPTRGVMVLLVWPALG